MDKIDTYLIHELGDTVAAPAAPQPDLAGEVVFGGEFDEAVIADEAAVVEAAAASDTARVPILVRVSDPQQWRPEEIAGLQESSRIGRIISATGTPASLAALQHDPNVESVEASRPSTTFDVVRSVPFVKANLVHTDLGETGDRALVAVIDSGIDVIHESFRDASGTFSRILAVWDQTDPSGPSPSPPADGAGSDVPQRGYGRVHTQAEINEYISTGSAPPALQRTPIDEGMQHGTHVTSIAAGRKTSEFGGGIAPDAPIVVVIAASRDEQGEMVSVGYSVSHADALTFIDELAQKRGLPVVVNVSQGMNAGAHDGKSSLEIMFDEFCRGGTRRGYVVVKSAGNERNQNVHARIDLATGAQATLQWLASEQHRGTDSIELWFESNDELEFRLRHPTAGETPWVTKTAVKAQGAFPDGGAYKLKYKRYHQDNGDSQLMVTIREGNQGFIEQGRWSLDIRSPSVQSESHAAHAWIEKSRADLRFLAPSDDMTVTIPGTADSVITVGSVDASEPYVVADYSCFGPTRDDRQKPDIAAPGQNVQAAMAGTATGVVSLCGTSMAAPHVAGAVALLLSRRAKLADQTPEVEQLNANQIAALLRDTTRNHNGSWTPGMGYGVLDVQKAMDGMAAI